MKDFNHKKYKKFGIGGVVWGCLKMVGFGCGVVVVVLLMVGEQC